MTTSAYNTPLTQDGFRTFCAKAAVVMAEDAFTLAQDMGASLTTKIEAAKWFAKMADYEPKTNTVLNTGAGFQLIINYSSSAPEAMEVIGSGTTVDMPSISHDVPDYITLRPPRNAQFIDPDGEDTVHTAEVG